MIGGQPLPHVRRQQERLITADRAIRLGHTPRSQTRITLAYTTRILRRAPNARNGTNSGHAASHSRIIAGYLAPHASVNSLNRSRAAASVGAV